MTDNQALEIFGPHAYTMAEAWRAARDDIWTQFHHAEHDSRCKTTLLQNHAVIHLKRLLLENGAFMYQTHASQHIFILPGSAVVVAKKLNKELRPSYHASGRGADFYSQGDIPGLEPLPRVICGAVLSDDYSSILGIYVTHPQRQGNSYNWALDITSDCRLVDDFQPRIEFPLEETHAHTEKENPFKPRHGKEITGAEPTKGTGAGTSI